MASFQLYDRVGPLRPIDGTNQRAHTNGVVQYLGEPFMGLDGGVAAVARVDDAQAVAQRPRTAVELDARGLAQRPSKRVRGRRVFD